MPKGLALLILKALRSYTHLTSLRGRTRLVRVLHHRLWRRSELLRVDINGVPFDFDLTEQSQIAMFYGFCEPNEIAFLRCTLRPGDVLVDAGANLGYCSAVAAGQAGPSGFVHAFEPVPWLHKLLQSWAEAAGQLGYRVLARQVALSNKVGETKIWVSKGDNIGWCTIVPGRLRDSEVAEVHQVPMQCLDDYFLGSQYGMPSVVKLDVEGVEPEVLEGMEGILASGERPVLMIEPHESTWEPVQSYLRRFAYQPYVCNGRGRLSPITGLAEARSFLAVWLPSQPSAGEHQPNVRIH